MEKFITYTLILAFALGIASLFVCLLQFAWNNAIAASFGAPYLSFWQTWGCMIVISFIGRCFQAVKSK